MKGAESSLIAGQVIVVKKLTFPRSHYVAKREAAATTKAHNKAGCVMVCLLLKHFFFYMSHPA